MTKGTENASEEIMAENAPNLKEEIDIQVQAAQRVPNKINPDRRALEHAQWQRQKLRTDSKDSRRDNRSWLQRSPPGLSADRSTDSPQARGVARCIQNPGRESLQPWIYKQDYPLEEEKEFFS